MFKINLIPEVKEQQQQVKKVNIIVTSTAVVVGVALGAIVVLLLLYIVARNAEMALIANEKTTVEGQLKAYGDLEKNELALENGLKEIKGIINNDSKWDSLFASLEKATPNDIQLKSFQVDNALSVSTQVEGASVNSIDRFIKSYSNYQNNGKNLFTNVQVDGYSMAGTSVSFSTKFSINPEAL